MSNQQIVIDVPEKVLLAEKTDADTFGKELRWNDQSGIFA